MGFSQALLIPYRGTLSSPLAIHPDLWLRPGGDTCFTGGCRTFTASDKSCFSVASSTAHNLGTGDALLPFAVKRSATGNQVIMGKYQDANNYWRLEFTAAHKLHFIAVVSGATKIEITSTTAYSTTGAWIFGCVAIDRSAAANCKIYVYGADDTAGTSTTSTDTIDNTGSTYFGQSGADTLFLAGSIASLAIGKPTDVATVVAAAVASFYNLRNAKTYAELTDAEVTNYGITCWYNGNETSTSANLIDQHDLPGDGSNDLVKTHAELVANGTFTDADGTSPPTGWSNYAAWDTCDVQSHAMRLVCNGDGSPATTFACDTALNSGGLTVGRTYKLSYQITRVSASGTIIALCSAAGPGIGAGGAYKVSHDTTTITVTDYEFTATYNSVLGFGSYNNVATSWLVSNVSLKATQIAVGNGPAEAIASDSIGVNHATLTGFTPAQLISASTTDTHNGKGYALTFDGVGNYLPVGSSNTLNLYDSYTVSAWVYCTSFDSERIIYDRTSAGVAGISVQVRAKTGKVGVLHNGATKVMSTEAMQIATWSLVTITKASGAAAKIYINSNECEYDQQINQDASSASGATAYIGFNAVVGAWSTYFFSGMLDDLRIYNVALTPAQVAELYTLDEDEEVTGATAVAQWRFDDGPFGQPADEDPILSWVSGDGDRYLFYQTTAASRPSYELLGVNSLPALDFDGTDYLYVASTTATRVALPTVLIVATADDPTTAAVQVLLSIQDDASANNFLYFGIDTNGKFVVAGNDAGTTFSVTGDTVLDTDPHLLEATWDGTNWHLKVDGVSETETRAGTECGPTDIDNMDSTTVGACYTNGAAAGASLHFAGLIADVTVKSAMSDGLLARLERHYTLRYGL